MGTSRFTTSRRVIAGVAGVAGIAAGVPAAIGVGAPAAAAPAAAPAASANIDRLLVQARRRYGEEVHGSAVHLEVRRVAADPAVRRMLQAGDVTGLRSYVDNRFSAVWYHQHLSHLRIMRGSGVLVDVGVPFVVAPATQTLRGTHGRALATLEVSIQDVVGYVRYMHRNFPVDVVARGQGVGHVKTSLPAAANVNLPARGTVTIAGRRYVVRSFHTRAMAAEPLTIWILAKA
jgi:hypothetical protein